METLNSTVQTMWADYLTSIGETVENTQKTYQAWSFGSSPDELAALVLKGDKRATTSLYEWYDLENEPVPKNRRPKHHSGFNRQSKMYY